jgi:transcription elongation regulator 1
MMPPNLMDPNQMPPFIRPFNANVSPFGLHAPPHFAPHFGQQQWQGPPPNDPAKMFDSKIDPKILAKAADWSEHRAPDGRPYYFNASKNESVWQRPQALIELDEARAAFTMHHPPLLQPATITQGNITFDSQGNMVKPGMMMNKQVNMDAEGQLEKDRKRKEESEKAKVPAKPQDKTRPISSTPIAGKIFTIKFE